MDQTGRQVIDDFIQAGQGRITITETAAATGLAIDDVKDALTALIEKYVCRLQVTEQGDLIYDFGRPPVRRDQKTLKEYLTAIAAFCWRCFAIFYRIMISVVLVVYFIFFFVLLVVIVIAALTRGGGSKKSSSNSSSSSRSSRSGYSRASASGSPMALVRKLGRMFLDIFAWETITGGYHYREDDFGYRYRYAEPKTSRLKDGKKRFVASVFDFVFGPPRMELDPLNNEKEVGQFLRENKGLIVAADLIALAGWTANQAREFFTDCLIRFQGDVHVSENGVVYGEFDQILRGDFGRAGGKIIYFWDEYEPEYELTGNEGGTNFLIVFLNAFNLVFSSLILFGVMGGITSWAVQGTDNYIAYVALNTFNSAIQSGSAAVTFALGWFPLVFSSLFFLIPLVRSSIIKKQKEKRRQNNIRRLFYRVLLNVKQGEPVTAAWVGREIQRIKKEESTKNYELRCLLAAAKGKTLASSHPREELFTPEEVETLLSGIALDLNGETEVSETAEVEYHFPVLKAEIHGIQALRGKKQVDADLGGIIADSDTGSA